MKLNDFEKWLDRVEKDCTPNKIDHATKEQFDNLLHDKISEPAELSELTMTSDEDINVDKILDSFDPEKQQSAHKGRKAQKNVSFLFPFSPSKVAVAIGICLLFINLSVVVYATVAEYYGVHKATPELEAQIDIPNETQMLLDNPIIENSQKIQKKYANTELLNDASFDDPSFYNTVTDLTLRTDTNSAYTYEDFIFNSYDIAAFKKEENKGWHLKQGEKLYITLAIDTSFAACEPEGEYIEAAYILNEKYVPFSTQKINNTPTVLSFTAPETGEYYFGIANISLSYIKITKLGIEEQ